VRAPGQQLSSTAPVVILGAGPAGLACAHRILRESGRRAVIVDKAPAVGGAGGSFHWKEHTLDYGPHAFHTRGDAPEKMVRGLFASDPSALVEGRKQVHVFLRGRRFRYPLQIREALLRFNPLLSLRIMAEFIATSILHALVSIPVENFENWGRKRFGPTLYRLSFGDYTEKVWKTRPDRISEKFAAEKIQGFSFITLIKRLLRIGGQVTEPYYQTWIYHQRGSGQIYDKLAAEVTAAGGEILLGTDLQSFHWQGRRAACVRVKKDGEPRSIPCSAVVSTIPLPQLVGLMGEDVPFVVRHAASKLRYSSLILAYLEFDVERVSDDHWFYLLDREFRFNRVTEQKNLSVRTMAPGRTVLSLELTCRLGDETWRLSDAEILELARADCRRIPFVPVDRITDGLVKRVPNVYEIYYKDFDRHADLALGYLMELENVVSIGRRGLFLQGDMHQSVEMGLAMGGLVAHDGPDPARVREFYRQYVRYLDL
jgi:protoporphyrinogen oxidase